MWVCTQLCVYTVRQLWLVHRGRSDTAPPVAVCRIVSKFWNMNLFVSCVSVYLCLCIAVHRNECRRVFVCTCVCVSTIRHPIGHTNPVTHQALKRHQLSTIHTHKHPRTCMPTHEYLISHFLMFYQSWDHRRAPVSPAVQHLGDRQDLGWESLRTYRERHLSFYYHYMYVNVCVSVCFTCL